MTTRVLLWDSVYGGCLLSPLCAAFFQAPEHHRLKHIAMNHADVLYPSLLYSRREHCIAVMALARRWSTHLTTETRLIDLIALAGLYHDVGHVALSHTMDHYLQDQASLPDHEARSSQILRRVNARLGAGRLSAVEEQFVCDAIAGQARAGTPYPTWAYHIVHQPDRDLPDVDRMVYLRHDCYKLGVPCPIDGARILSGLYSDPQDQSVRFTSDCVPDLRAIREVRTHMFTHVFQHATVCTYQTFLLTRFCALYTPERLMALFQGTAWLELTDVLLWSTLHRDADPRHQLQTYRTA